jgi:hypothetical protein
MTDGGPLNRGDMRLPPRLGALAGPSHPEEPGNRHSPTRARRSAGAGRKLSALVLRVRALFAAHCGFDPP